VILQEAFAVEPWALREVHLDLGLLAQTESLFTLSNGHVGWRGNLDEGEPHGLPGSYLNGVYETRPLPYAETAYGLPESGQEVINVTNGKLVRLFVDDEPFDVRYGHLRAHQRTLDFRAGTLSRTAEWVSPAGRAVRVSSTRLVSLTQRAIAAIRYEVEPLEHSARIAVQSELLANEQTPVSSSDPRVAAALENPLVSEYAHATDVSVVLVHSTKRSKLRIAAAMGHLIEGPSDVLTECRGFDDGGVVTAAVVLKPGQKLTVTKFVAYGWSGSRSLPGVRDQVWAALTAARQTGWDGLLKLWDAQTGTVASELRTGPRPLSACAVAPDGKTSNHVSNGAPSARRAMPTRIATRHQSAGERRCRLEVAACCLEDLLANFMNRRLRLVPPRRVPLRIVR